MKKIAEKSGFGGGFKPVLSRKKRKGVALEEGVNGKRVPTKEFGGHSWGSETNDTTESKSIDMEEECLIEETSFNYGESGTIIDGKHNQMPKRPSIKTKKTLGKLLKKISFSSLDINDDILLDASLELSFSLKNLVSVSVRKSFALDIGLDRVKVVSKVNGFREVSTPLKFSGIIRASFISEVSLAQAMEKARAADILVNTNLKKSTGCLDRAVVIKEIPVGTLAEAVCAALSEFGIIKSIKMQLVELWQKAIVEFEQLDQADLVTDKCAVVCFKSAEFLDVVMGTTLVFKGTNLRWSSLVSVRCAKCGKLDHMSLNCTKSGKVFSSSLFYKVLLDADKSRLTAIYAKQSAPVACPISFGGFSWAKVVSGSSFLPLSGRIVSVNVGSSLEMKPSLLVVTKINDRFAALKCSLTSLAEHVDMLAKKLETSKPIVSQLSLGCQLLVTLSSQNQKVDTVMSEGLGVATDGKTVAKAVVFDSSVIEKMEDTLKNLAITVMGLLAKMDNAIAICNIRSMNNPVKQDDIIVKRYENVCVFTSGLDFDYLGSGVIVVINASLARHVCKISEVPGWLICIRLLFKNKLSVLILGLYAGASPMICFSQANEINSLVARAVNKSSFVIFGGNFNENGSHRCASFKKCLDLRLVNSLVGIAKVIDYVLVSANLVGALVYHSVLEVGEHFDTDHQAVSVSVSLGRLLNAQLNFLHKRANMDCWKYDIKSADDIKWCEFKVLMVVNTTMFSEEFVFSVVSFDLDSIIVKVSYGQNSIRFASLMSRWASLDSKKALAVQVLLDSGVDLNYESSIRSAIDRRMESFASYKSHIIRSVLEYSFHKMKLNHLVVGNKLILEPKLVKAKVDVIMEGWTRRCKVLFGVISDLPDGKAAGFFGIPNELWKHCNKSVMGMLLKLLNTCLINESVPSFWREAWVSIISKPYKWKSIFTNIYPIILIKTAHKILSKILFDRISLACSSFNVLCGDNFSVLKGTSIQSPIFAVGSVIEDILEKNCELWLVLQDT
ncbi:hypothetical protein G9A89_014974 [Geosiphon pyriformis]|nr:hypothetical protein G9A89_014974 [Geosiphon pyriformis]